MNNQYTISLLILLTLFAFVINLPFGYLRGKSKKFSFQWFLYIHLPIPFVIVFRLIAGFSMKIVPIILAASILGQIVGARLDRFRSTNEQR
ncbi:MAG: hypothetical protein ACE5DW_06475 [Thermodesulfobacteriota bacterium]